jgi:hypothetical protein
MVHMWRWGIIDRIQKVERKIYYSFGTLWLLNMPLFSLGKIENAIIRNAMLSEVQHCV